MNDLLQVALSKIDYRITGDLFSRPQTQVKKIVKYYKKISGSVKSVLVDVGGGHNPQYKNILKPLAHQYVNMEVTEGPGVDIVGSVYNLPFKNNYADVISMFMVLEHLSNPHKALLECNRVLKKRGYVLITTVQYWHTHNHPSDYFRYTKQGLEMICKTAGFDIVKIWSIGGPPLVIFHSIELNLAGGWRIIFSILFYRFANWLDWILFKHEDTRLFSDSVGWACIVQKR